MNTLSFNIPEILSLLGTAFCIHIIVYMIFRSGRIARAMLPMAYFLLMGLAFLSSASFRIWSEIIPHYEMISWSFWFAGPPLSVLLIVQIAQINKTPDIRHYWVLLLLPLALVIAQILRPHVENFDDLLKLSGLIIGGISILTIWLNKNVFASLTGRKTAKERYWLVLSIIIANIAFLTLTLASLSADISDNTVSLARTILGLTFIYLINTSLFRIYPQAVEVIERRNTGRLTAEEMVIARKVDKLLQLDKVYQEPAYARADLAKECGTSEAILSRIINIYFTKSFTTLMNEHRVEDAKRLLLDTKAPVKIIAQEVGFNALPSFNRVFKEMTGESPTSFRKNH